MKHSVDGVIFIPPARPPAGRYKIPEQIRMTFIDFTRQKKPVIDRALARFFDAKIRDYAETAFLARDVMTRLKKFSVLGKSIRGCLVMLSASMFGCGRESEALKAGMAVELVHSGFLVHDDIMDNDLTRRGQPTVFAQYIPSGKKIGFKNPYMFGVSMGICAGDLAYFLAEGLLQDLAIEPVRKDLLIAKFNDEITKVGLAQMDDVYWGPMKNSPPIRRIERIYSFKTSRYTFSLPLMMGAVIAGRPLEVQKLVEEIGEGIGLLFQLRDDTIGLLSSTGDIGKPAGSDVRENKKTLIRHYLYRKAGRQEKKKLDELFGKQDLSAADLALIRGIWEDSGMDEEMKRVAGPVVLKVKRNIRLLDVPQEYRGVLEDLLAYVVERKK